MEGGPWLPAKQIELRPSPAATRVPNERLPENTVLEGKFQDHDVLLQRVACPAGEWDDDAVRLAELQIEGLRSLAEKEKGVADVLGLYKENNGEEDVYLVLQRPDGAVSLRNYLQQRGDITWNERLNIAEKVVDVATVIEENLPCPPTVDARSILVTDEKDIRLAGIRATRQAKQTREVSVDVGLLLVELMTKQPPVRSQSNEGSLVEIPSIAPAREGKAHAHASSSLATPPASPRSSGLLDPSSPSPSSSGHSRRCSLRLSTEMLDLSSSNSYARKDSAAKDRNWEKVQQMAFTAWMNSYLAQRDLVVNDLQNDLRDGVLLNSFLEIISNKPLKRRWNKKPINQITMRENLGIGLSYIQQDMGVKLVGIGAEDLYDANMKLILGLVWSLFKALQNLRIAHGDGSMEEGLMQWVRDCAAEANVNVDLCADDKASSFFKYAFRDGKLFAAILAKYELLDFEQWTSNKTSEDILPIVFQLVEDRLKVPRLLEPSDLLGDDPDERAIQLYVSLIFDALHKDTGKLPISSDQSPKTQVPSTCPPELLELAKACCSSNPDERPSLQDIRQRIRQAIASLAKEQADEVERDKNAKRAPQPVPIVIEPPIEEEKISEMAKLMERLRRKKAKIKNLQSKLAEAENEAKCGEVAGEEGDGSSGYCLHRCRIHIEAHRLSLEEANEREQLSERVRSAEEKARAQDDELNELMLKHRSELTVLEKRVEEQSHQLAHLNEELQRSKASEQALAAEKAQLETSRERDQKELQEQADERKLAEQELRNQLEALRSAHEQAMRNEQKAREDLEEQLRKAQNDDRSAQLEAQLKASSEEVERLKQDLEVTRHCDEEANARNGDELRRAQEKERELADKLAHSQQEKEKKDAELEDVKKRLNEAERRDAEKNEELLALRKARSDDQERVAELTATLSAKTDADRPNELIRLNEDLRQKLKREQEALQLKQSEVDSLREQLVSTQDLEKLRQENETLGKQVEALKDRLDEQQQRGRMENESLLKELEVMKRTLELTQEAKQREIDLLAEKLIHQEEASAGIETLHKENESLKEALAKSQEVSFDIKGKVKETFSYEGHVCTCEKCGHAFDEAHQEPAEGGRSEDDHEKKPTSSLVASKLTLDNFTALCAAVALGSVIATPSFY